MDRFPTEEDVETVRSVAIDICTTSDNRQHQMRRALAYVEQVKQERGEDDSKQVYNILWASIRTHREVSQAADRDVLKTELKKAPIAITIAVIAGLILAFLVWRFGISGSPPSPTPSPPAESGSTGP